MSSEPFTVTSFAWAKKIEDRLAAGGDDFDTVPVILAQLSALASFLDRNRLTTRRLTNADGRVGEDFVLQSDDLTPLGLELIRNAYENWQRQAKTPTDVRPLEKALERLRA